MSTQIYIYSIFFFFLVYMCHMITHPYFYFVTLITFILIYLSYGVCFTIWGCLTEALVWKIKWFYFILFCFVLIVIFLFIMFCLIWFHFIILVQFSPLSFVLFYFFLNIGSWGHLHTFLKFFLIMPLIFISGTGRQRKTILLKFKVIFYDDVDTFIVFIVMFYFF